jgi:hypothetical protein
MQIVGRYRNIIWTFGNSVHGSLRKVIKYTPESMLDLYSTVIINHLGLFLKCGGRLWTGGRGDGASGGLAVMFHDAPAFPASIKFDMAPHALEDTSGADCFGYRDYCISIVDKMVGPYKVSDDVPIRVLARDAMRRIEMDDEEVDSPSSADLPRRLELADQVTQPGMFFDPMIRGFSYVEVYDSEYWLEARLTSSQPCFHPIYRMRSRSTISPFDKTVVAIWIDKYDNIIFDSPSGAITGARSIHFGVPLWFFDHAAVDSIADAVFREWGILDED